MMKISKSKRQLAQLLIEAGVKKFPNGADWAAQGSIDLKASFYSEYKPKRGFGEAAFCGSYCGSRHDVQLPSLINNWHQTVLSRDEFDQIVAETAPDADGWIEWKGGECPVGGDVMVVCKVRTGKEFRNGKKIKASILRWRHTGGMADIIAYRLHKPQKSEPQYCEPVTRSTHESTAAPTIDQLLQDWRNADDFAKRKQAEADEAAAMRDERWQAVQDRAGEVGVMVGLCESVAAEPEQVNPVKPVMTGKFRNAKIGSPKHYISNKGWSDEICDECGKRFGAHFGTSCNSR